MKRLPKIRIVRASPAQRKVLARWMREWATERALEHDAVVEKRVVNQAENTPTATEPLAVGQIRLFRPFSGVTQSRPRYFAILDTGAGGTWVIAPFGRFRTPAVPGEWQTGRRAPALAVLCVWNRRALGASIALQSWVVDHLKGREKDAALAVYAHAVDGSALPAGAARRVGPLLQHPLDPRHDYLDEERSWLDSLARWPHEGGTLSYLADFVPGRPSSLKLAAEPQTEYRTKRGRAKGRQKPGRPTP